MTRKNTVGAKTLNQKNRKSLNENIKDLVLYAISGKQNMTEKLPLRILRFKKLKQARNLFPTNTTL